MSAPATHYCVLDFEATCEQDRNFVNNEVIEFPVVVLEGATGKEVAVFHEYVRPVFEPKLSAFCTSLTGITQVQVDAADPFPVVYKRFQQFMANLFPPGGPHRPVFVTCGDWDLKTMLPKQCSLSQLEIPSYLDSWINIKQAFADFAKRPRPSGMPDMLSACGLPLVGRHHSGIDDTKNIAAVLRYMIAQGYVGSPTFFKGQGGRPRERRAPKPNDAQLSKGGKAAPPAKSSSPSASSPPSSSSSSSPSSPSSSSSSSSPSSSSRPSNEAKGKGKGPVTSSASAHSPAGGHQQPHQQQPHSSKICGTPFEIKTYASEHLFDIGANLAHKSFQKDLPGLLRRSYSAGVKSVLTIGTSVASSARCQSICKMYQGMNDKGEKADKGGLGLYFSAGVHPHDAKTCDANTLSALTQLASDHRMVAIGECGLDFDRNFSDPQTQLHWFEEQVKLAIRLKKPLYLHERKAHEALVKVLRKYEGELARTEVLVHCFTGTHQELNTYLSLGCYIGITGWICGSNGAQLREVAKRIPLDRVMIETDAPFLAPKTIDPVPQPNEPCYLGRVAEALAEAMQVPVLELISRSTANAHRFFRIAAA